MGKNAVKTEHWWEHMHTDTHTHTSIEHLLDSVCPHRQGLDAWMPAKCTGTWVFGEMISPFSRCLSATFPFFLSVNWHWANCCWERKRTRAPAHAKCCQLWSPIEQQQQQQFHLIKKMCTSHLIGRSLITKGEVYNERAKRHLTRWRLSHGLNMRSFIESDIEFSNTTWHNVNWIGKQHLRSK